MLVDDSLDLKLPSTVLSVQLPAAYVSSLSTGSHAVEVLAIDVSGNQTITESSFNH